MTCCVLASSFVSSDNYSVVYSLNALQSNGTTPLLFAVVVAATPSSSPPDDDHGVDWQEVTTIAVAAGIVVGLCRTRAVTETSCACLTRRSPGVVHRHRLLLLHRAPSQRHEGGNTCAVAAAGVTRDKL
jgi:hypothetical protein